MNRKKKKNIQIDEAKLKEYEDLIAEINNDANHPKLNEFQTKILNKEVTSYDIVRIFFRQKFVLFCLNVNKEEDKFVCIFKLDKNTIIKSQ